MHGQVTATLAKRHTKKHGLPIATGCPPKPEDVGRGIPLPSTNPMDSSLPAKLTSRSLAISVCITVKLKPMSRKANRRLLLANLSPVDFIESSSLC